MAKKKSKIGTQEFVIGGVVLAGVGFLLLRKKPEPYVPPAEPEPAPLPAPSGGIKQVGQTLRKGDRGPGVQMAQTLLTQRGHAAAADGVFGPGTEAAAVSFQRASGLQPDGVIGPKTWAALQAKSTVTPQGQKSVTDYGGGFDWDRGSKF